MVSYQKIAWGQSVNVSMLCIKLRFFKICMIERQKLEGHAIWPILFVPCSYETDLVISNSDFSNITFTTPSRKNQDSIFDFSSQLAKCLQVSFHIVS